MFTVKHNGRSKDQDSTKEEYCRIQQSTDEEDIDNLAITRVASNRTAPARLGVCESLPPSPLSRGDNEDDNNKLPRSKTVSVDYEHSKSPGLRQALSTDDTGSSALDPRPLRILHTKRAGVKSVCAEQESQETLEKVGRLECDTHFTQDLSQEGALTRNGIEESDGKSFEWQEVPPPTQLTTQQVGRRGRAVIPGAFEVILRRPSSKIQSITADNEIQDGIHPEGGGESTDEPAMDALRHLPSE